MNLTIANQSTNRSESNPLTQSVTYFSYIVPLLFSRARSLAKENWIWDGSSQITRANPEQRISYLLWSSVVYSVDLSETIGGCILGIGFWGHPWDCRWSVPSPTYPQSIQSSESPTLYLTFGIAHSDYPNDLSPTSHMYRTEHPRFNLRYVWIRDNISFYWLYQLLVSVVDRLNPAGKLLSSANITTISGLGN